MLRLRTMVLTLALTPLAVGASDYAYVIDKLLVGVHRDRDLNSAIIKVLPTGSQLQVLERTPQVARVKDTEGVEGWVDTAYLMKESPAVNQLAEARQERQMLLERIKQMEVKQATAGSPQNPAQVDKLTNESQLSSLKLKGSELERQLKSRGDAPDGSVPGELRKANLELEANAEALRQRTTELEAQLASDTALGRIQGAASLTSPWAVLGCLVLIVLSFGAGMFCMDYLNRRRHGGFRL